MRKADNLPPSCAVVTKSGNLNFLRNLWACPGLEWDCFTFYLYTIQSVSGVQIIRYVPDTTVNRDLSNFCVAVIHPMMADLDSRNMLWCEKNLMYNICIVLCVVYLIKTFNYYAFN